ncbi:MAG: DUF2799 domain-containing protein [Panacagrimonas sp.]
MRPDRGGLLLVVVLLTGCATLDESECRSANWFEFGRSDGALGYSRTRLDEHRQACSKFGLAADTAAWEQGYAEGLDRYCSVSNGYQLGRRGGYYGRVCPAELDADFSSAYALGRETHEVDQQLDQVNQRINALESRLIGQAKLSDPVRQQLRYQLSDLYRQMVWLRRSRDRLEDEWRRWR